MRPEAFIILTPGFAADEHDSTCIPSQQIFVRSLKHQYPKLNVIILSFQYPFIAKEYDWNDCKVIAFGGKEKSKLFRLMIWIKVWRKLKMLHKNYDIKGILSFWLGECAFVGKHFSSRYNIEYKCWLQGQDAKAGNKYVKKMRPIAENLIALSDFLALQFYQHYTIMPEHIITVGIDETLFKKNDSKRNIDIIGVGSLIELKQYDVFIECVNQIKKIIPNIYAVIVGKGSEGNTLRQLIASNDLEENIFLAGELPHTEVLNMMQQSKILFHSSSYEGFGAVCVEALYAGCKVISFTRPMQKDIENWYPVNTKEEMVDKATAILNNKHLERKNVLAFSIIDNVKKMMGLFDHKETATA